MYYLTHLKIALICLNRNDSLQRILQTILVKRITFTNDFSKKYIILIAQITEPLKGGHIILQLKIWKRLHKIESQDNN